MEIVGISPAYFISRFSGNFAAAEIGAAAEEVTALGFSALQPEVYRREDLPRWDPRAVAELRRTLSDHGLRTPQLVAHFLGAEFADPEALSRRDTSEFRRCVEIAASLEHCRVITLPQPPFQASHWSSAQQYRELKLRLLEKLHAYLRRAEEAGLIMALEILPHSLAGGTEGFLSLYAALGRPPLLGYNFDTGHAWACKEDVTAIPLKLGPLVSGTHLCDNHAGESLSLKPGDGTIDWPAVLRSLSLAGYTGSLDLEINCPAEQVESEYRRGREALDYYASKAHGE
jgi:sugar phosphate isomerase/epimerase